MKHEPHIAFGPFRLEATPGRLWRGAESIALRPQSLAVLRYLVMHPGRLVTKAELQQQVWEGAHVTATVVRGCIWDIRAALGDSATTPQYLETVGRQGYRFLALGDGIVPPLMASSPIVGRQGLAVSHDLGGPPLLRVHWLAMLAEAYGRAGQPEVGLTVLAEALTLVATTKARWWEAELYRLQGEILLAQAGTRQQWPEAEACFHQALDVARGQQAKALELRTALSLSRLWQLQGKRGQARQALAEVYSWFTEGFDTADLQEARALLEALT